MVGSLREKLEQCREFRSDNLQEEKNKRKARVGQHNQLIIQNYQWNAAKSGNPKLVTIAGPDLGFVAAKTVKWFISSNLG